ncbi:hypothetical protein KI387_025713, partial [Taxus chinensis]
MCTLELEVQLKYLVTKSDDPKVRIIFKDANLGTYFMTLNQSFTTTTITKRDPNEIWTLEFDCSYPTSGFGAGLVLISLDHDIFPFSFKLQFDNTNNTTEYEALLLCLKMIKEKGVKNIKAQGDVELIVNQVKNVYQVKNDHLKHYSNMVWDCIEDCEAFSIKSMFTEHNDKANSLVMLASLLLPHPKFKEDKYTIEIDSEWAKAIQSLTLTTSKTNVYSFFGKVNFLTRFVLDFVDKTRHIVEMVKGKVPFQWSTDGKSPFNEIKKAIAHARLEPLSQEHYSLNLLPCAPFESQVLLDTDPFLTELTKMYERTRDKGSVWVTLKRSSLQSKRKRKLQDGDGAIQQTSDYRCLVRATDGKKTISTTLSAKDHQRFQAAYAT